VDVEKTIQFLLENQGKYEAAAAARDEKHAQEMAELRESHRQTSREIRATQRLMRSLARQGLERIEAIEARQDAMEEQQAAADARFTEFLKRLDAFLQGRTAGNGNEGK
jgi:hypothetical protein